MPKSSTDELLSAVGEGLSEWSSVEHTLAGFFSTIADLQDHTRGYVISSAILAFDARLAVVDRLVLLEDMSELEIEMWAKLSARISKYYRKRHELAHFSVGQDPNDGAVCNPFANAEKTMFGKIRKLTVSDIRVRIEKFKEIRAAIDWFWNNRHWHRKPDKHLQPPNEEPPLVPQLRELANRSLEERKQRDPEDRR